MASGIAVREGDARLRWQGRLVPLLAPAAWAYGGWQAARRHLYSQGLLCRIRANRPVVSVGSLVAGGAGKTPMVAHLADRLKSLRVVILSRGYGGRYRLPTEVSGASSALEVGDEPVLLARSTCASVWVGRDRARLAVELSTRFDLILLDDGFQHLRLRRDFNVCMVPDLPRGRVLPAGLWRERPAALSDADFVVAVDAPPSWLPRFYAGPVAVVRFVPAAWNSVSAETALPPRVAAFCGIARPERFFASLDGLDVVDRVAFPDHAVLSLTDLEELWSRARRRGALALVTTAKDFVRFERPPAGIPLFWRDLGIEWLDGEAAFDSALRCCVPAAHGFS